MLNLENKTVIITGASRGIGKEIALAFAHEKINLSLWFEKNIEQAEEVANAVRSSGSYGLTLMADVSSQKAVTVAVEATLKEYDRIDILINNAGVSLPDFIHKSSEQDWDKSLAVNLKGVFLCSKAVIPVMIAQGGGHIINISSVAAIRGIKGGAAYAASKAGVIALTQCIAKEYGRRNIRANCVLPGFHKTDMTAGLPEEVVERTIAHNVLGRTSTLEEVSSFIVFLSKTENISGQVFNLDSRIKREI